MTIVQLITGGYWSTYWYNGNIYGAEIARGIDVFRLKPSQHVSQSEIAAAGLAHAGEFNAQQQTRVSWPASAGVARAYLDQLRRTGAIRPARAQTLSAAFNRVEALRTGHEPNAAADLNLLETLACELEGEAARASGRDGGRLRALAATLKARAAALW